MSAGLVCVFVARSPSLNRMEREQYQAKRKKERMADGAGWTKVAKGSQVPYAQAAPGHLDLSRSHMQCAGVSGRPHRGVLVFIYPNRALVTIGLGPVAAIG